MKFVLIVCLGLIQSSLVLAQSDEPLVPPDPFAGEQPASDPAVESPSSSVQEQHVSPTNRPRFSDPFKNPPQEQATEPSLAPTNESGASKAANPQDLPGFLPPLSQEPEEVAPKKAFEFPTTSSNPEGPKTQELVLSELSSETTAVGTYSLNLSFGGGFNVNRRNNQSAFEISGDYRFQTQDELGMVINYRIGADWIFGALATYKRYYRVTPDQSFRIELAPIVGIGWNARADNGKFNEGRFPMRYGVDVLMYAFPRFAVIFQTQFESFLFGYNESKTWSFYFSNGGPPTQILTKLGVRFQF